LGQVNQVLAELSGVHSPEIVQIIRQMPIELANKIAAGEVVQRPASAVKELIENALDAGATEINLILKSAGSELIQVVDNGCGMSAPDAVLAFSRHATSKLTRIEDLNSIRTFGFRGEALSSIAAVSKVVLRTRQKGIPTGIEISVEEGIPGDPVPNATREGTSISVRNLFYNVPARRNFLKKPATELKHIIDSVHVLAMANVNTAFKVSSDGNVLLSLPVRSADTESDLFRTRLGDILSVKQPGKLITVSESTSYLSVSGLVGRPEDARRSRGQQFLFVNGRYVRHRYIEHAIFSAYEYLIPDGTYPLFAIFLDIDPRHVDVNVHPTKAEVKFDDERGVYSVLRTIIRKSLGMARAIPQAENARPLQGLTIDFGAVHDEALVRRERVSGNKPDFFAASPGVFKFPGQQDISPGLVSEQLYAGGMSGIPSRASEQQIHADVQLSDGDLLWQLHDSYVLTQIRSGLVIIDQQAAHERVLYEKAIASLSGGFGLSQQLLFPRTIEFDAADFALIESLIPDLRSLGFDLDKFGGRSIMLRGVPADMVAGDERSVLDEVLEQYKHFEEVDRLSGHENLARSIARKSAVKPGKKLSVTEMRALIDQLFHCELPYESPGGKPTIIQLSVSELRERFGRSGRPGK